MKLVFLGTGSVYGAPVFGCRCSACYRASNFRQFARKESSVFLQEGNQKIIIDAGLPNLTEIVSQHQTDTILLTHYHVDHVQGLFKLRWGRNHSIKVIGPDDPGGCADLHRNHGILDFSHKAMAFKSFNLGVLEITPLPMVHSKVTYGYFIKSSLGHGESIAYLTDTVGLLPEVIEFLQQRRIDLAIIDASEAPCETAPRNHNDLNMALDIHAAISPTQSLLTHIGHELDEWLEKNTDCLPSNVGIAFDGQAVDVNRQPELAESLSLA